MAHALPMNSSISTSHCLCCNIFVSRSDDFYNPGIQEDRAAEVKLRFEDDLAQVKERIRVMKYMFVLMCINFQFSLVGWDPNPARATKQPRQRRRLRPWQREEALEGEYNASARSRYRLLCRGAEHSSASGVAAAAPQQTIPVVERSCACAGSRACNQ